MRVVFNLVMSIFFFQGNCYKNWLHYKFRRFIFIKISNIKSFSVVTKKDKTEYLI